MIAVALGMVGWLEPGPLAAVLLVAITVASATQDVAIDGYTASILPERLHGRANGLRVAAYRGAMLLAGGGAVALAGSQPWSLVFLGLAAIAAVLAILRPSCHAPSRPVPAAT